MENIYLLVKIDDIETLILAEGSEEELSDIISSVNNDCYFVKCVDYDKFNDVKDNMDKLIELVSNS